MWTEDDIRIVLKNDPDAVPRAIKVIYQYANENTAISEQRLVEFRPAFPSQPPYPVYLYKWLESGKPLTGHHLDNAIRIVHKYTDILAKIANGEVRVGKSSTKIPPTVNYNDSTAI